MLILVAIKIDTTPAKPAMLDNTAAMVPCDAAAEIISYVIDLPPF
jgi:hypothetical protein